MSAQWALAAATLLLLGCAVASTDAAPSGYADAQMSRHVLQVRSPVRTRPGIIGGPGVLVTPAPMPKIDPPRLTPTLPRIKPIAPRVTPTPKVYIQPPPRKRCRRNPCAERVGYKVKKCRYGRCRDEWKFKCTAGWVCN